MPEKVQNRKVTRSVGSRMNPYSEDGTNRESADLQKTVEAIADKVDTAVGAVEERQSAGSLGSMRFVKDKKDWYLEFKTEDGWVRSDNSSSSGFILRDKK
mgnify:CR=1 FL=1|jgi:hypothetical protein|tara:strand:+ start:2217 stop:2516 length:300 start_codon:yes stop_codon:yes gene_type:complete